jgi:ABC-type oligopeptide transport system substrate-binding subunit
LALAFVSSGAIAEPVFRVSNLSEPASFSTLEQKTASGAFILAQIHAPLLWFEHGELKPHLAKCWEVPGRKGLYAYRCEISKLSKFSNGEPILASHVLATFQEYLNPLRPGLRADLLLDVENSQEILQGKLGPERLGFEIDKDNPSLFTLHLLQSPEEFKYNLANPLLAPLWKPQDRNPEAKSLIGSGAYFISSFQPGRVIKLLPNPYFSSLSFPKGNLNFSVEFHLISDDNVALSNYERGDLDLLRRFPSLYLKKFKSRSDLSVFPQFRFDFFAFGPQLKDLPKVRKVLSESLDYEELGDYFSSPPRPGCPGLPEEVYGAPICLEYKIKASLSEVEKKQFQDLLKSKGVNQSLTIAFGKAAAEDVERTSVWMQDSWMKKLGISSKIKALENKIIAQEMRDHPAEVFRRGYGPDRPTCLAVAENFRSNYDDNPLPWMTATLEPTLIKMKNAKTNSERVRFCRDFIKILLDSNSLIPTGPMIYPMLINLHWRGVSLTELNILNLANLSYVTN